MSPVLASYISIAACVYVFLWIMHVFGQPHPDDDELVSYTVDTWWGRMLGSWLWPVLLMFVGLEMYKDREN